MESVNEISDSISQLEKQANELGQVDLGLDNWIEQFDRFERELKEKAGEIEGVKKQIMSFNNWDDKKELDQLAKQLQGLKKEYDVLIRTSANLVNKSQAPLSQAGDSNPFRPTGETTGKTGEMDFSLGKMLDIFGGTEALKKFVSDMINVRGECQKLEVAFGAMLGSKGKADMLMSQLAQTAAKTPFDLQELAGGARQLLIYGTEADQVNNVLGRLGDLSSGLSIPLGDMVELYGKAQTQGQLFASDVEQFTSRGIPLLSELAATLGKTESEIQTMVGAGQVGFPAVEQVIRGMTSEGGQFYNQMEKQSQTLTGQIANLSEAWDLMLNEVGKDTEGVSSTTLSMATSILGDYERVGKGIELLISVYGSYKAAVAIVSFVLKEQAAVNAMVAASNGVFSKGLAYQWVLTERAQKAMSMLNKTMLTNPYVLLATAALSLAAAYWVFHDSSSAAERAQKKLNKEHEEAAQRKDELASKTGNLVSQIDDETLTVYSQVKAFKELLKLYPELRNMSFEEFKGMAPEQRTKMMSGINDKREVDDASGAYEEDLKRIEYLKNAISTTANLPNSGAALSDLNRQLEVANNLARRHKEELEGIKQMQWEANTPVEEKVKYYEEVRDQLIAEREELEKQVPSHKVLSSYSEDMLGSWFDTKNIIESIKLDGLNKQIDTTNKKLFSLTGEDPSAVKNKSYWEQKKRIADTAQKDLPTSEIGSAKWKEYDEEKKGAQKEIDKYDAPDNAARKAASDQKQRLEKEKSIHSQLQALRAQNQQDEINLMQEGAEKKKAQIELDYDREIAAIQAKVKEWEEAQNGELTSEQTSETHGAFMNAHFKKQQANTQVDKDQADADKKAADDKAAAERQAMNGYLKEYGTYLQKRQAITDLYNDKIAKAATEGEKLSLGKELTKSLSGLDVEANKTTAAISRLFGDMSKKSVKDLRAIADQGKNALDFLKGGKWDAATGDKLGMSEDTFKTLSGSPEEIEKVGKAVTDVSTQADQCDTAFNQMGIGLKKMFSSNGDEKKLAEGMAILQAGMGKATQAGQFLSGTLSSMGDALGSDTLTGMAEGLNVAMGAADAAMKGAQAGAMFGPMGMAAGAAVGAVTSLVSSFAKLHDAKYEKRIQEMQKEVDNLGRAYDRLGRAIDNTYSNAVYGMMDEQAENLKRQQQLVLQQKKEEEAKKKTDKKKTQEYDDKYEELGNQAEDLRKKQIEMLAGTDVQSAIDDFANALVEAYAQGEDGAEAMGEVTKKVLANAVKEALKKQLLGDALKNAVTRLGEDMEDGSLSDEDKRRFENSAQSAGQRFMEAMKMYDDLFKGEGESEAEAPREASAKGIASMSQESADLLNGQFTTQLIYLDRTCTEVTGIREQMAFIHELQIRGWEDVRAIRDMSGRIAELSDRIATVSDKIEINTGWTARGIQDINDKGVLMRGR